MNWHQKNAQIETPWQHATMIEIILQISCICSTHTLQHDIFLSWVIKVIKFYLPVNLSLLSSAHHESLILQKQRKTIILCITKLQKCTDDPYWYSGIRDADFKIFFSLMFLIKKNQNYRFALLCVQYVHVWPFQKNDMISWKAGLLLLHSCQHLTVFGSAVYKSPPIKTAVTFIHPFTTQRKQKNLGVFGDAHTARVFQTSCFSVAALSCKIISLSRS